MAQSHQVKSPGRIRSDMPTFFHTSLILLVVIALFQAALNRGYASFVIEIMFILLYVMSLISCEYAVAAGWKV